MKFRRAAEEQAIFRHRVVNAGARQDQSVVAAEGGDQDGAGHDLRPAGAEDLLHNSGGHAIFRRVLDAARHDGRAVRIAMQRQRQQINDVGQNIEKR